MALQDVLNGDKIEVEHSVKTADLYYLAAALFFSIVLGFTVGAIIIK